MLINNLSVSNYNTIILIMDNFNYRIAKDDNLINLLQKKPSLTYLDLNSNTNITDKFIYYLIQNTNIKHLNLSSNKNISITGLNLLIQKSTITDLSFKWLKIKNNLIIVSIHIKFLAKLSKF